MTKKKDDVWDVEGLLNKREQYLQAIQDFRILDDAFMKVVLKDTECVKYGLDTILDDDLTILESNIEVTLPNRHGRGTRLDVYARDSEGKQINLEIPAGRFMHDITVKSAAEMHPSVLAERVRDIKESTEGQHTMSKVLEDLFREDFNQVHAETLEEGIEQGRALERIQTILTLAKTMSAEKIAEALELSPDFVQNVFA